jgi:hypothetical protein
MRLTTFWIVWAYNGGTPTVSYRDQERAHEEAERLARAHPEQMFCVMESVAAVKKSDVQWLIVEPAELGDDEIPF